MNSWWMAGAVVSWAVTIFLLAHMLSSRSTIKHTILLALSLGPAYGSDLHPKPIGPLLRSMEREGLLRSWDGASAPGRGSRPKRYYELTKKGHARARRMRETLGFAKKD